MTSSETVVSTPISVREYVVLNRVPRGRYVYSFIFEISGSWQEEDPAKEWASQHCNSISYVELLQSPEPWQEELKSMLQREQSTGIQRSLPHIAVLVGDGKRDVVGPLFFPLVSSAGARREVYLPGLGKRVCEDLVPFLDYKKHPDKAFKMDGRIGLYLPSTFRR